jgi:HSP20 family protein
MGYSYLILVAKKIPPDFVFPEEQFDQIYFCISVKKFVTYHSCLTVKICHMEDAIFYHSGYFTYPGNPVPMVNELDVQAALLEPHEGDTILPPVNVSELVELYKVEVAIPGVSREDFLIRGNDNVLLVCVLHKEPASTCESYQLHEFNYECVKRPIVLPSNAEVEFSVAEYKNGILRLFVPKSKQSTKNRPATIVVY